MGGIIFWEKLFVVLVCGFTFNLTLGVTCASEVNLFPSSILISWIWLVSLIFFSFFVSYSSLFSYCSSYRSYSETITCVLDVFYWLLCDCSSFFYLLLIFSIFKWLSFSGIWYSEGKFSSTTSSQFFVSTIYSSFSLTISSLICFSSISSAMPSSFSSF